MRMIRRGLWHRIKPEIGRAVLEAGANATFAVESQLTAMHGLVAIPLCQILKRVYFMRTDFPEWGPVMMLLHQLYLNVELAKMTFQHVEPYVRVQGMTKKLVPVHE